MRKILLIFMLLVFENLAADSENGGEMRIQRFNLGLDGAKQVERKNRKMFVNLDESTSFAKIEFKKTKEQKTTLPKKPKRRLQIVDSDFLDSQLDSQKRDFAAWLGHSSIFLQINGFRILVDPIFSSYGSPVFFINRAFKASKTFGADDFGKIDIVLLTHSHYDHLDKKTIKSLKNTASLFIVPLKTKKILQKYGVNENKIIELDWWDGVQVDLDSQNLESKSLKIIATPQQHGTMRLGYGKNEMLWASFVLESRKNGDGRKSADSEIFRIFLSGDGAYGAHFAQIGKVFGKFDYAFMENGQYNPAWSFFHSFPHQTIRAASELGAKVIFPIHWGKFKLSNHGWYESVEILSTLADEAKIPLMVRKIGEIFYFDENPRVDKWYLDF